MADMTGFDSQLTSPRDRKFTKQLIAMYTIVTDLTSKQLHSVWNRFIKSSNRVRTVLEVPSDYYLLYLESGLRYNHVYKTDETGVDAWLNSALY